MDRKTFLSLARETDAERERWNAALATKDQATIDATRHEVLTGIHGRIMRDDRYQERTH